MDKKKILAMTVALWFVAAASLFAGLYFATPHIISGGMVIMSWVITGFVVYSAALVCCCKADEEVADLAQATRLKREIEALGESG